MIMQLSRNPPFGICWQSTLWGAGEAVYREESHWRPSTTKLPEGSARGSCWLCPRAGFCCRSLPPEGWMLEKQPAAGAQWGEAVSTGGAGRGTNHSYCSSLALDKPPALPGPRSREAPCVARARC